MRGAIQSQEANRFGLVHNQAHVLDDVNENSCEADGSVKVLWGVYDAMIDQVISVRRDAGEDPLEGRLRRQLVKESAHHHCPESRGCTTALSDSSVGLDGSVDSLVLKRVCCIRIHGLKEYQEGV